MIKTIYEYQEDGYFFLVKSDNGYFFSGTYNGKRFETKLFSEEQMIEIFGELSMMAASYCVDNFTDDFVDTELDVLIDNNVLYIYLKSNGMCCFKIPFSDIRNVLDKIRIGEVNECDGCAYSYGTLVHLCYCTDKKNDCKLEAKSEVC
jgi:hypothetical protein